MRDTIEMAREAGYGENLSMLHAVALNRFAELVRADERAECVKVCEEQSKELGGVAEGPFVTDFGKHTHMSMAAGAENCAAAIRARSNK